MDNLLPNTEYHISVTAYTNVGPGAVANLSVTTTSATANAGSMYVKMLVHAFIVPGLSHIGLILNIK